MNFFHKNNCHLVKLSFNFWRVLQRKNGATKGATFKTGF